MKNTLLTMAQSYRPRPGANSQRLLGFKKLVGGWRIAKKKNKRNFIIIQELKIMKSEYLEHFIRIYGCIKSLGVRVPLTYRGSHSISAPMSNSGEG